MPNLDWSKLNNLQLGEYAEYYAKMEFASYGYYVYSSEVDDHGVDFVAKTKDGHFLEVQVKSSRKTNYVFIAKDKIVIDDHHLVCFLRFTDGEPPQMFIIPATAWLKPNEVLVSHDYEKPGQSGKPEWGINWSKKNAHLLDVYKAENFFARKQLMREEG